MVYGVRGFVLVVWYAKRVGTRSRMKVKRQLVLARLA
jgi:hypothetical protein